MLLEWKNTHSLCFSLQNLAMFLSMLVAWMIPDVPRSLREQLKKENLMLMEFLLNQDQEACAKSHSTKHSNPCFPANIDIVVEAPHEEQEMHQVEVEEEEEEEVGVEINVDEPRRSSDSDPEIGKSVIEAEYTEQEGGDVGDKNVSVEAEEKDEEENREEMKDREEKGSKEQERGDEKEEGQQKEEEKEDEAKAVENENFTVDLDSFMDELGLLGKRRKPNASTVNHPCCFICCK